MQKRKDPKKVRAGRLGGRKSGGNFKRNREAARAAGRKSAWSRASGKLSDFPLEYEDMSVRGIDFAKPNRRRSFGRVRNG